VVYHFDDPPIGVKPQFQSCPKLTECGQCGIYEDRPKTCSDFQCAWLTGELPERFAPKDCGFVVNIQTANGFTAATLQECRPGGFIDDNPAFEDLISGFVRSFPHPVILSGFRQTPGPVPLQWIIGFKVDPTEYANWRKWLLYEAGHPGPIPDNPPTPPANPRDPNSLIFPGEGVDSPSFYAIA
jgi:hypothetical protein